MDFELVLACDLNRGIGSNRPAKDAKSSIPWKISDDMKHFKALTTDRHVMGSKSMNAIVMGRRTADTFKVPLPGRLNVVITSVEDYRAMEGFVAFKTFDEALDAMNQRSDIAGVFVIGGKALAESVIDHPNLRGAFITVIGHRYEAADICMSETFFRKVMESPFTVSTVKKIGFCKVLDKNVELSFQQSCYFNTEETQYLDLLEKILTEGEYRDTRNAKTYSLFGERLIFDLKNGFPLLTTKKMFTRGILEELIFFLQGKTGTKILEDKKVMIWHGNTTKEFIENNGKNLEEFDMGPMYGFQWRHFNAPYRGSDKTYEGLGVDQLQDVVTKLVKDPHSRRILMTTYNPAQTEEGVLYPCHGLQIQFYVENGQRISLQMYQRSVDTFLGLPFNIASYAALLHIIVNLVNNNDERVHESDYLPGRVIMILGDTHIYSDDKGDHVEAVKKQLKRRDRTYSFPDFKLNKRLKTLSDLNDLTVSDMEITGYRYNSTLRAKMIA